MLRLLKRLEIQFVIECFDVNRSWKVPMVETNYGGKLYSPSDEVETIAGHVFKSPKPPRAQHGKRQCQQQSTAAITGGSGVGIDGNGIQRQSSFLLKRLDAKKSMAEISIPVRIGVFLLYVETFFRYLLIHGFPIWVVSISIDAFLHDLRFPSPAPIVRCFSIKGMRAVFGLRSSMIRRIIWIFILITCFSICAIQVRFAVFVPAISSWAIHRKCHFYWNKDWKDRILTCAHNNVRSNAQHKAFNSILLKT